MLPRRRAAELKMLCIVPKIYAAVGQSYEAHLKRRKKYKLQVRRPMRWSFAGAELEAGAIAALAEIHGTGELTPV